MKRAANEKSPSAFEKAANHPADFYGGVQVIASGIIRCRQRQNSAAPTHFGKPAFADVLSEVADLGYAGHNNYVEAFTTAG